MVLTWRLVSIGGAFTHSDTVMEHLTHALGFAHRATDVIWNNYLIPNGAT